MSEMVPYKKTVLYLIITFDGNYDNPKSKRSYVKLEQPAESTA